ncbi:MAG TPA: pyridoxamine 5'-phosphate oxidase [Luteibaculaceae bacterium]|nr:pyridoxamine 5'-phosphate oxidase [Luteibaculaceae bacterium]
MSPSIEHIRKDYTRFRLDESDMPANPMELLQAWVDQAISEKVSEPNAMQLISLGFDGIPEGRVVLLRGIQPDGLRFYTNYRSAKGQQLVQNNRVSANFFWPDLERQIRIKGEVHQLSAEESDVYFDSRPRESQLGAWASDQSEVIANRQVLIDKLRDVENRFAGKEVPRPDWWGGYRIAPFYFEFWQGGASRLHDRLTYQQAGNQWKIERLSP